MKIRTLSTYPDKKAREAFARLISGVIMCGQPFDPYCPNPEDHSFWKLDGGNDWSLTFLTPPDVVELRYRYQAPYVQAEEALCGWLVFRLRAELVL